MDLVRWQTLMQSWGISPNEDVYQMLFEAYSEKHRRYHTVEHISATLRHLDDVVDLADSANEIEMALWFHDAVYKTVSSTNELDSAALVLDFLSSNGVSIAITDRVYKLVMATDHRMKAKGNDQLLIVDIDLSILGANELVFSQFEKNVRYEYRHVPNFLYSRKRKEILANFLQRDRIYQHDFFHEKLEKQARINLESAIGSR